MLTLRRIGSFASLAARRPISQRRNALHLFSRCFAVKATTGTEDADLVVIGGGPGGYVAAIKAAQEGLKVVHPLVSQKPLVTRL